jgi:aminopeptidase N
LTATWCAGTDDSAGPDPGVALALADSRAQAIEDVRYDLSFSIPPGMSEPIAGKALVRFNLKDTTAPLVLDFEPGGDHLTSVSVAGKPSSFRSVNGHIVIPQDELTAGENHVEIAFRAGDAALNRNPEFLYSLFVPARARLTFPCFDQPNMKARFTLELTVPAAWEVVSNGAEALRETLGDRLRVRFAETAPISTYLFAFAAGRFQIERAERGGREYRMLHRETDAKKVARNRDTVFDLHASALEWLERYTGMPYPFGKFDFLLVPSFQFGGMEHPGSIYYNAASILLDESATENQMLGRASVIAHETAHMWFGDLVTMKWFNDVWMKEVFANFMAAKIVNPAFPRVNHELRFLVAHYPTAYSVDRTAGTHPIRQELANLNEAGSLYGPIIYQKAPIVMRQLERLLGVERMQEGLRAYLKQFAFGNATWLDLVRTLDALSELDIAAWSRAWVEEAGRPSIRTDLELDAKGNVERLSFVQSDEAATVRLKADTTGEQPTGERTTGSRTPVSVVSGFSRTRDEPLRWTEQMDVIVGTAAGPRAFPITLSGERTEVAGARGLSRAQFVLPTGGGLAYGGFTLDERSRAFLLEHAAALADPVTRGAVWVTLWDEMLERRVAPAAFLDAALGALASEHVEQNVQLLVGYVDAIFWRFLSEPARTAAAPRIEAVLRSGLTRAPSSSLKATYFSGFRSTVTTPDGVALLERVWRRQQKIPGLTLAEPDEATMALELAVRSVPDAQAILEEQRVRFANPDRKARFEFVMPALSGDAATRDLFFQSLRDVDNRRREPWVIEGVRYLNHPLRAAASRKHLRPALELLADIQRTGDIFFPKNWMDAVLGGHNTREAAAAVRAFLDEHQDYPIRLRRVILQSADDLLRAAEML